MMGKEKIFCYNPASSQSSLLSVEDLATARIRHYISALKTYLD